MPAPARQAVAGRHVASATESSVKKFRDRLRQYADPAGYLSWSAGKRLYTIAGTGRPSAGLVPCPSCGGGMLMVVRSRSTGKRFVGCSNYRGGCSASSPLPQRGLLRATRTKCASCRWPVVALRYGRGRPWQRRCSNLRCPLTGTGRSAAP